MSERTVHVGEREVAVGPLPGDISCVYEARFTKPTRHVERHLRGYGRDERDAVISLFNLGAQRTMLRILDQG